MPQHSDSDGALPADTRPLEATASVSTLGSNISDSDRPAVDKDCPEALIPSDNEEQACSLTSIKRSLNQEDEAEGEGSESDDILMEDNQVADFASTMLAAISCWHYKARALLSMGFPTVRFSTTTGILLILLPDRHCACQTSYPRCMCCHRMPP